MSAPDWREVFAKAIDYAPTGGDHLLCGVPEALADAVLAAISARGYRLHRDHDFPGVNQSCTRCGARYDGFLVTASCEGRA